MRQNDTYIADSLTPRQQTALPLIAAGPSLEAGARDARVSRTILTTGDLT